MSPGGGRIGTTAMTTRGREDDFEVTAHRSLAVFLKTWKECKRNTFLIRDFSV
ncbi:hypothetical protein PAHAL_6G203900 [Panicum hallii]|uniref:Uncharacterized protein n=1 Tax=Panicum hallii TaxID=206008 RepID=A0A2S3I2I5_9POAL|nr:hypothetical protein PAHAL_6G203900 [Panicum hallii]